MSEAAGSEGTWMVPFAGRPVAALQVCFLDRVIHVALGHGAVQKTELQIFALKSRQNMNTTFCWKVRAYSNTSVWKSIILTFG